MSATDFLRARQAVETSENSSWGEGTAPRTSVPSSIELVSDEESLLAKDSREEIVASFSSQVLPVCAS